MKYEKASRYGSDKEWEVPPLDNQVAVYDYRTADGSISFQEVKLEWWGESGDGGRVRVAKKFLYRSRCDVRSGCDAGFHYEMPARAKGLIYHLPEVLEGMRQGYPIWITEGGKDCDLWNKNTGYITTTMHQGAEVGPNRSQAAWLRGYSDVRILMDNDGAGANCAFIWAELLGWNVYVYRPYDCWKDIGEAIEAGVEGKESLVKVDPFWLREKAEWHRKERSEAWKAKGKRNEYQAGERLTGK